MQGSQYQNVFFYYRGPSAKGDLGAADVQVEDNTTKALVNLLRYSEPELADSWIDSLHIASRGGGARQYFLQRTSDPSLVAEDRFLVIITAGAGPGEATWAPSDAVRGRVDAALYVPGEQLVVIESKVAADLDGGQLVLHASDWNIATPGPSDPLPPQWRFTTWFEVFSWGRAQLSRTNDPVTRFLLEQFCEYLAILGLAPVFAGFRPEDLEYLAGRRAALDDGHRAPIDLVQGTLTKDRLAKLWQAVQDLMPAAQRAALGTIHVGALQKQDDHFWAASNWGETPSVNLTLELAPSELQLNLVAWTAGQVARFETQFGLLDDQALYELKNFSLVIWRRRAIRSKAGTPFWMGATSEILATVGVSEIASIRDLQTLYKSRCKPKWERLAYHLRRSWPGEELLQAGETMAAQAAREVVALIPAMRAMNGLPPMTQDASDEMSAGRLANKLPKRTMSDLGYQLRFDCNQEPVRWQFVADGPSIMVTSPSGGSLRGVTFHIAIAPTTSGCEFVACAATRAFASGGATGWLSVLYRGGSLRTCISVINRAAASWTSGWEGTTNIQPQGRQDLSLENVTRTFELGAAHEGGRADELARLAQTAYERSDSDGWVEVAPVTVLAYSPELVE